MRLKFLIGILALLLLMVSTASAYTEVPINIYKDDKGDTAPPNTAIKAIYDGNTIRVKANAIDTVTGLPANFDIQGIYLRLDPKVANPDNTATATDESGEEWKIDKNMPTLGKYFGVFSPASGWVGDTSIKSGGEIVITYPTDVESTLANVDGFSIVVKVSWGATEPSYSNWVGGKTSIPEFASIALPMAAIIGLLFLFGRRKQE